MMLPDTKLRVQSALITWMYLGNQLDTGDEVECWTSWTQHGALLDYQLNGWTELRVHYKPLACSQQMSHVPVMFPAEICMSMLYYILRNIYEL